MKIVEVFYIQGRGHILSVNPPPQDPGRYVGQVLEHEDQKYEVVRWEGMQCLVYGCDCIRSVAFICKKLELEETK